MILRQPLVLTGTEATYNISIHVAGGGDSGQAGAVRLGIARALCDVDPNLRGTLKKAGLLVRDASCERAQETGSQARPQGPPVHQALIARRLLPGLPLAGLHEVNCLR